MGTFFQGIFTNPIPSKGAKHKLCLGLAFNSFSILLNVVQCTPNELDKAQWRKMIKCQMYPSISLLSLGPSKLMPYAQVKVLEKVS